MNLFGKKKSGQPCAAPASTADRNARFIVLGACCKKSAETFENVRQAVKELGLTDPVVNLGDSLDIARYGVLQTPALVIDGKVVSYGKFLSVEEAKNIIQRQAIK